MNQTDQTPLAIFDRLPSKRDLIARIEHMSISADAKALLIDIASITVDVAGKLISAGRQIIAFVVDTVQRFPNTAFGLVAALVVAALIASVPFLGAVLGPLLTPLLVAFGLAKGALQDIRNGALHARVRVLTDSFLDLTPRG